MYCRRSPVRRVHVRVMGIQPRGSPARLPDGTKRVIVRSERSLFHEWISGEPRFEACDVDGLVGGLDVQLQVSPGSPAEGHEFVGVGAGRGELIDDSLDVFAGNFVAIAFLAGAVE